MTVIFVTLIIFILIICLILFYKQVRQKLQITFLQITLDENNRSFQELNDKYNNIIKEKIDYIKQNEYLAAKIEQQEKSINDFEKLSKESRELTKAALFDLGNDLSKQLIEIHKKETAENRKLSEENIENTSKKFHIEFENIVKQLGSLEENIQKSKGAVDLITNSLLSPSGAGHFAEITLENILKSSGLKRDLDFSMQYNLTMEDNSKLRPDAVIFLPSDHIMIIDAKASKFLIDEAENVADGLAKTMNSHLKSLASKDYAQGIKLSTNTTNKETIANVTTLMFLPSEHAIEKITAADSEFLYKAQRLNIFPVGPAGLMSVLSLAKFQITENRMINNYLEIVEEVKKFMNSISLLADHSAKLGSNISSLVGNYDKFAGSFNKHFLSKAQNLSKLGMKSDFNKEQNLLPRYQLTPRSPIRSPMIELEEEKIRQVIQENSEE